MFGLRLDDQANIADVAEVAAAASQYSMPSTPRQNAVDRLTSTPTFVLSKA